MPSDASDVPTQPDRLEVRVPGPSDRREFLRIVGLGAAAACLPNLLTACSSSSPTAVPTGSPPKDTGSTTPPGPATITLDFSSDTGVLNYAYLLEQLAAGFYAQVKTAPPANMAAHEQDVLQQIGVHETIHMTLLKNVLGSSGIPAATLDFASVNLTDRTSVLTAAKTFEDLDVGAYNGAVPLLQNSTNFMLAAKIVSVEARHAAAVRDLLAPGTSAFAGSDVINANGFDQVLSPSQVVTVVTPFVKNKIVLTNVPSTTA